MKYLGRIRRCRECPHRVRHGTILSGAEFASMCGYLEKDRHIPNPNALPKWCPLPDDTADEERER